MWALVESELEDGSVPSVHIYPRLDQTVDEAVLRAEGNGYPDDLDALWDILKEHKTVKYSDVQVHIVPIDNSDEYFDDTPKD